MGTGNLMSIGMRAMAANFAALQTTGHNIANANVDGYSGTLEVAQFKGGQSNPTFLLSAGGQRYVLRRKPLGQLLPSAHAVDREFKVIAGLHPTGFPVAKPYGLCTDDSVIGSWFYVMGMVYGRTIWNGAMPGSNPTERRAV